MPKEDLKVNDKRMFTADGELREEFRHLEDAEPRPPEVREERAAVPEEAVESPSPRDPEPVQAEATIPGGAPPESPRASSPAPSAEAGPVPGELSILDLVGLLAEHTALYLGEAQLPDGQSVRDLSAAKLHLDLLDVLRRKTAGNLSDEETKVLEDVLYRLRMLYVEKKRQE